MLTRTSLVLLSAALALGLAATVIVISSSPGVRAGPPPPVTALDQASIRAAGRTIALPTLTVKGAQLVDPMGPGLAPPARILAAAPDGSAVAMSRVDRGQVGPLTIAREDGSQLDIELPGVRGAAFDAPGTWLAVVDLAGALWGVDAQSGAASRLADGPYGSAPAVLADGRILAIRLSSVDAPTWAAAVMVDPSSGEESPVGSSGSQDQLVYQATPLSDGTIALVRHRTGGGVTLVRVRADGSEAWLADLEDAPVVAISPDGQWLAWAASGRVRISRIDRGRLTRDLGDGTGARFSGDSSLVLLFGVTGTRVVDLNGNAVTEAGPAACWLGDGRGCQP
ncbi:MAG: TolB family protein [Candidatus Limnocylindria bacterium]